MNATRVLTIAAVLATLLTSGCKDSPNILGVSYGDPTGLTFRHKLDRDNAVHVDLATDLDMEFIHGHIDYQLYIDRIRQNTWNLYWGVGVSYSGDISDDADPDRVGVGFRIPLGSSYEFDDETGDFFVQIAPYIVGDNVAFTWAVGIRFGI